MHSAPWRNTVDFIKLVPRRAIFFKIPEIEMLSNGEICPYISYTLQIFIFLKIAPMTPRCENFNIRGRGGGGELERSVDVGAY